ncbi:hypothetical protein [Streptococcus danieliae]|uniref:hypothetical protein n=1 Tax=Streptococcus danieliae TaxID=747656 RepID=UPI0021C9D93F|nr:hypothetical protein [Streptococcus danieliae]MCU0082230.1 hypothetical protein [Streptococcus danieliae]
MLETLLTVTEILALGTASVAAIDIMLKKARQKRQRELDAAIAKAEARAYEQAQRDIEQERQREREAYKRNYTMLDPYDPRVFDNVILMPCQK